MDACHESSAICNGEARCEFPLRTDLCPDPDPNDSFDSACQADPNFSIAFQCIPVVRYREAPYEWNRICIEEHGSGSTSPAGAMCAHATQCSQCGLSCFCNDLTPAVVIFPVEDRGICECSP